MIQDIFIIDEDKNILERVNEIFKNESDFNFSNIKTNEVDIALKNIPSLIIINADAINTDISLICKKIRENEDNSITPIIVISSNSDKAFRLEVLKSEVEYFIVNPIDDDYLYYTIKNIIRLMYTNRRVSPLTGLPGNVQIQAEMKKRLLNKETFGVLYFDLDNFKAYNDTYGFLQGDEIIKFTARTIVKNVHTDENKDCFVGHIGGDDFVALVGSNVDCETICQNVIAEFDIGIQKYFSDEDLERGYFEIANRKGILEQFPLTSISIGVVIADQQRFYNTLEIAEVGAQVKHTSKIIMGSSYVIDKITIKHSFSILVHVPRKELFQG